MASGIDVIYVDYLANRTSSNIRLEPSTTIVVTAAQYKMGGAVIRKAPLLAYSSVVRRYEWACNLFFYVRYNVRPSVKVTLNV